MNTYKNKSEFTSYTVISYIKLSKIGQNENIDYQFPNLKYVVILQKSKKIV